MKTKILFIPVLLLVAFTVIMASCTKDDPAPSHENFFQVDNEVKLVLTQGFILDHGIHGVSGANDIRHMHCDFLSSGLSYDQVNEDFYGKGSRVSIAFFTDMDGQIPTGTYKFDHDALNEAYSFDYGFIWEDHDTETGIGDVHEFTDGTCIVIHNEQGEYDFTWNIKLATGKSFTGTYKGKMTYKDVE